MKTAKKKGFRVMSVFMCFLILISGILVIMGSIRSNQVAAANEITFYFDSSCLGKNSDWVDKNPEYVYYYAYKSTNNTGIKRMEPVSGKTGSDGGKLYKGTVKKDQYSYLIILKNDHWSEKKYQTLDYSLNNVKDKDILILNTSGYNVGTNEYVQGMYVKGTFEETTNYSSQKFSILNMDDQDVTLQIKYSTLTKKYENGQWGDWNSNSGVEYSDPKPYTISARQYKYKQFEVPARESGKEPWQSVHIYNSDGTKEIKKYYFPEGKILGKSFFYGITDFHNTPTMDYGDGTKLCYITSDLGSLNSTSYELYFDKNFFTLAPQYGKIGTDLKGDYSPATALTKDGNAKYVTDGNVSLDSWSRQGDTAVDINLSSQIMSVEYNGVQYNLFAPQNEGDNLVKVNDNVAVILGKYTVQSTGNVLTEKGDDSQEHKYNYITTQADFYDYQYDGFDNSNFKYRYTDQTKQVVYFENNWYKQYPKAYFYGSGGTIGENFPGTDMVKFKTVTKKVNNNDVTYDIYKIDVPANATGLILSYHDPDDNQRKQSLDIVLSARGDDTCYYCDAWDSSSGEFRVNKYRFEGEGEITSRDDRNYSSQFGNAKRPYVAINEFLSKSSYAQNSSNYPMYLGQFWLPLTSQFGGSYATSSGAYTAATAAKQRAGHNGDGDAYFYDTNHDTGYYRYFGFGNYLKNFDWSANLAYRYPDQAAGTYKPYNAVVQGLVNYQLGAKGTANEGKLLANDGNNPIPYFDYDQWNKHFTTSQDNYIDNMQDYIKPYYNYAFPFFETAAKDVTFNSNAEVDRVNDPDTNQNTSLMVSDRSKTYKGTYYVFDSSKNVIRVNEAQKKLDMYYDIGNQRVGDNYGKGTGSSGTDGSETGLFPFNTHAQGGHDSQQLHYGFGVKFSIDFFLNENGTLDGTTDGIPISFTFQGDDDVWVFLDDQLILDMGGAHKNAIGEINFKDKIVYVGAADNAGSSVAVADNYTVPEFKKYFDGKSGHDQLDNSSDLQSTATVGRHKITMYYLERGMLNSNLYVMFNLPLELTKYDLQTDTDFTGINTGFTAATMKVAENDVFNYQIQNKGTSTSKVLNSEYKYPSNTTVTRTNSEFAGSPTTTLSTSGSETQTTHNFQGSPGGYQPMMSNDTTGVTYQLTEPYFGGEGVTTFDTRSVTSGSTTAKGVVSMQYGEMATFSKQLEGGSQMKVKLLETLSKPSGGSRLSYGNDGRRASVYYTTHYKQDELATNGYRRYAGIYRGDDVAAIALKHVDPMYDRTVNASAKNYSTNHVINPQVDNGELQFVFADPKKAADGYVYLRQVVVNEVKTVKLRISKDILANENCSDTFNFKIVFSNIFGADTGDSDIDYDRIAYKKYNSDGTKVSNDQLYLGDEDHLNNDGSFSLKKGQYIEIENIPVKTKYYLTETPDSQDFTLSNEYSVNMGSINNKVVMNGDMAAVVTNKRTTGTIQVQKLVYDESGNLMNGDGSLTTEFTLMIGLKAPGDVNLDNYPIKFMQNGTDLVATGKAVVVSDTSEYTIDYPSGQNWQVYNVKVKANRTANGAYLLNIQNVPHGTEYKVHERSVPLGFVIPTTKPTNSVWNQSAYNCNTSGTYANVMYKDSAKTLNNTDDDLVTVENNLNPIEMPSTGGSGVVLIFPLGILAIVLSGAAVMIYKRKIDNGSILRKGRYMK